MTLNEWLNSTMGEGAREHNPAEVAEIHQRLDSISRQIEQMSQGAAPRRESAGVARQLNDAISRLDARLSQLSGAPARPPAPQPRTPLPEPPAPAARTPQPEPAPPPRATEPPRQTTIPELLKFDVAEILARQSELNTPPRLIQPEAAPPLAPQAATPDLSGFEKQLKYLTSQIEGLRRPDGIEQAIAMFRSELAEMRQAITDALPRRALDTLENEIRAVARRIDESRQNGADRDVLSSIEQALRDIYSTLRTLTPAEQLAGFDDAIRNLGGKIDLIVRASADPSAMRQLEDTIGALRAIVANVASNEALAQLSDEVHGLAARIDQLAQDREVSGSLAALEQRIAQLTSNLESRDRPSGDNGPLEQAVRALSDRIDHLQVGSDASSAFTHLEQRVLQLLERLESADFRAANFGRVEDGLSDILRHLEQQRLSLAALGDNRAPPLAPPPAPGMDPEVVDAIRRELSDLRLSRTESERNTQDALESVHNTLGHVVDRLAMIETDLRESRAARATPPAAAAAPAWPPAETVKQEAGPPAGFEVRATAAPLIASTALSAPMPAMAAAELRPELRPELPNPAAPPAPLSPPSMPPGLKDILLGAARDERPAGSFVPTRDGQPPRAPIDPSLPPDFPLEPGTRPQDRPAAAGAAAPTPSERIAASEQVLSEIPAQARETPTPQNSTSSFIAAARRAAQAAAAEQAKAGSDKPRHLSVLDGKGRQAGASGAPSTITAKIRSLLVGASVVVIVLSGFKMAMNMLEGSGASAPVERPAEPTQDKFPDKSSDATVPIPEPSRVAPSSASELTLPAITSPTPIERQGAAIVPVTPAEPHDATAPAKPADVTGTVPVQPLSIAPQSLDRRAPTPAAPTSFSPVSDPLPDAIGGPVLRAAALRGDPTAAFEVGSRYSDGRGVPVNYDEAAKWLDRAADGGIVPAMFRLGTMYEKGLGGKKDVDAARRYYIRAAERGNAKAMHNLAVLDADGGAKGPNYKSAAEWFRKAADHGVADSQFNLGILYARGIGVEQNLAESYKWFTLAAAQGDADAGRKRDDVAKRLDAQSLAAAKLAAQTFVAQSQPDDAVNVTVPTGGWDATPAPAPKAAPKRPRVAAAPQKIAQAH